MTTTLTSRAAIANLFGSGLTAQLTPLFRGWAQGLYALPPEMEQGLGRLGQLQDLWNASPSANVGQVTSEWARGWVAASEPGAPAPTLDELTQACSRVMQAEHTFEALRQAQTLLVMDVVDKVGAYRDVIFDDHVRPPLASLYEQVQQVAEVLGPHRSAEDLLTGTDEQRAAWLKLPAFAATYHKLRATVLSLDYGLGRWQLTYHLSAHMPELKNDVGVLNMGVPSPLSDGDGDGAVVVAHEDDDESVWV